MCLFSCCLFLKREVIRWRQHYIYFSKPSSILFGLVLAYGLVENAVVDALMLYLLEEWKNPNLTKAAAIVIIQEAISSVIALIVAILTEVRVSRFKMVLFTAASFILGLLLLLVSSLKSNMKDPLVYAALLLIAFGKAGTDPPFRDFIGDQIRGKDTEQVADRTTFWWRLWKSVGAAISAFMLPDSWKLTFLICAAVMGVAYLIFLAGIICPYNYTKPSGKYPFSTLLKVVKAAFAKRGLNYPRTPSGYYLNQGNELPIFPPDPFIRRIDKAAILEQTSPRLRVEEELQGRNRCTVAEVKETKSFLRLAPLWFAFSLYGVVTSAGNTFFIEQSSNLDQDISGFTFPINAFFIMRSIVAFIASYLADLVLSSRYCSRNDIWKLNGALIRVGAGIVLSIVCCGVASLVEQDRLDRVGNLTGSGDVTLHMSILWLAPQYIILGLMDGLSEDGLSKLFGILVHKSMEGIESSINQLVLGIGTALSVGSVFVFRGWFGDSINTSQLDQYYAMLMYLSIANLVFYVLIGYYYVRIQKRETRFQANHAQPEVADQEEQEPVQELELALELDEDEDEDEGEVVLVKKLKPYKTM